MILILLLLFTTVCIIRLCSLFCSCKYLAGGNCSSHTVIYILTCKICSKCYIGRSTRPLKTRVGEHRRLFYKLCNKKEVDLNSDEFALGNHLFSDHSLQNRSDFDDNYNVSLLDFASPS